MRETRIIMGMPVTVEAVNAAAQDALEKVFAYMVAVDERFSTYKNDSEVMRINRGEIPPQEYSPEMREVLALAEKTKKETNGYFDIKKPDGSVDPSGVVKGWAIQRAAELLLREGCADFYVEAGGDIQTHGVNASGGEWSIGIRNPFAHEEIVKVVYPRGRGVATSGTYIRGQHIYNPHKPEETFTDVVSLTVIGPSVLEADCVATAAFAMGADGIHFVENLPGFAGYAVDSRGIATMTSDFETYTKNNS